jgi:hypothetical protein
MGQFLGEVEGAAPGICNLRHSGWKEEKVQRAFVDRVPFWA